MENADLGRKGLVTDSTTLFQLNHRLFETDSAWKQKGGLLGKRSNLLFDSTETFNREIDVSQSFINSS